MEGLSEILRTFMVIVGLVQVLLGFGAWYLGIQVKMLRLELVNKEHCGDRHAAVTEALHELQTKIATIEARVAGHLNLER